MLKFTLVSLVLVISGTLSAATFYRQQNQPIINSALSDVASLEAEAAVENAYYEGKISLPQAQQMFALASAEQGATAAEIWNWIQQTYGQTRGTVKLGYRCVKAYVAMKWCGFTSSTDSARKECVKTYGDTVFNNCVAQQQ